MSSKNIQSRQKSHVLSHFQFCNTIGQGLKETADEFGGNGTSLPMFIEAIKFHLPFK